MLIEHRALWAKEAEKFFQILFHQLGENERIELRYRLSGAEQPMSRRFLECPGEAADFALALGPTHEVYTGVAPRQGEVGTKEGVTRLLHIWGDYDVKGHHTQETRLEQLTTLPYHPSILVWSGGGFHPYWSLEEPAEGPQGLARAERIMGRIAEGLDGDPVHDCTRILRVPGTLNHKGFEPRPVRLAHCDPEQRYTLDELEEMAESLPKANKATGGKVNKDVLSDPICEGERNTVLTSVAGSLRDRGLDEESLKIVLLEVNHLRCEPALSDTEVERIAKSVCRYPAGIPRYVRSSVKRIYADGEVR